MAKLFPDLLPTRPHDGGLNTELEVLRALELELPDAYSLFHSVGWTVTDGSQEKHGEADIVVVNQAGDILVIEVKAGAALVEQGEVFKAYRGERKSVSAQVSRTYHALRKRLEAANIKPEIHTRCTTKTSGWVLYRKRTITSNSSLSSSYTSKVSNCTNYQKLPANQKCASKIT